MKNAMTCLKQFARNHRMIFRISSGGQEAFFCVATMISPKLNTQLQYLKVFHRWPDLKVPKTFNEKLLWLKLKYMNDPLVIQCADKFRVREYVQACGCGQYLNELYGVYDQPDEIPWDNLPERFVLKWNFGAGMNVVCADKRKLDREAAARKLNEWRKRKVWLLYSEMQYKYAPKKLVCERFLDDDSGSGSLTDYKVYCFHGEPKAILVMHDRNSGINTEFFDVDWEKLENASKYEEAVIPTPRPTCLEEMLDTARRLSKPFDFVRCDFYIVRNQLFFGEMTFTPAGCLYLSHTKIDGKEMTEYLHIP